MRTLSLILIALNFTPTLACDFSTGIVQTSENTFEYTKECHEEVGIIVKELDLRRLQVDYLKETIKHKDKELEIALKRVDLWKQEAEKQAGITARMYKNRSRERLLWIGVGVLATGGAAYLANQVR